MNTLHSGSTPSPVNPTLFVLNGPAGCGKTTLCKRAIKEDSTLELVITATTRPMRDGEVDGKDYHFLTKEEFKKRIHNGDFIEHATVHGELYGVLKTSILEPLQRGQDLIMNIDAQGVRSLQKEARKNELLNQALCTIFIKIDLDKVRERLLKRGTESPESISERMRTARIELARKNKSNYSFVSHDMEYDFAALDNIIYDVRVLGGSQRQN